MFTRNFKTRCTLMWIIQRRGRASHSLPVQVLRIYNVPHPALESFLEEEAFDKDLSGEVGSSGLSGTGINQDIKDTGELNEVKVLFNV